MGLTIGGSGIGQAGANNIYGNAEHDSVRANGGGDNENAGEDLIMMNIPREGNADQLNKSTKLTLSSKKQYENHLQNISIHQHLNNSQGAVNPSGGTATNNQYMLQVHGAGG